MAHPEYQTLNIASHCDVGVEVFSRERYSSGGTWLNPEDGPEPLVGDCLLRGIPFRIGEPDPTADSPRYIGFLEPADPVSIEINRRATTVIFAHVVLSTRMWIEGDPPGRVVARYRFAYEDGEEETVPIRERFEIGHCPQPWGHRPFLAYPDRLDGREPRSSGDWNRAGYRLTEVTMGTTHGYTLWPWFNPSPDRPIARVTIEPLNPGFIVAGITTSTSEEHPFQLPPRRPIRIDGHSIGSPDEVDIRVDRGVATYTYAAVDHASPGWDGFDGWGGTSGPGSVYGYVAAIPSATLEVDRAEADPLALRWGDLADQPHHGDGVSVRVQGPEKNWVHVTVKDENGAPTPCRVSFVSEEGIPYPPHGHQAPVQAGLRAWNLDVGGDVLLGDVSYAYIDGRCQGWLPQGKVWVEVARGFEYEPTKTQVDIRPGQRELDIELNRHVDLAAEGWYSGDTHVHFLSPDGALTEAAAEGLTVVNLLQAQWGHLFTNVEDFTGKTRVSEDGRVFVHVSQENRQHVLGHINLLGLKRPVMPFSSDGASEAELGGGLEITTSRWADAAHADGATVIVAHMPMPNGETAVLISTGRADGVEMIDFNHFEHLEYYRYLNGGYRLPLVGGTDKMEATMPVGLYRTYAKVDGPLSLESWLAAVRAGRTFATSGPLISFSVDGSEPGDTLNVPRGGTVTARASVTSIFPIHTLQIVQGGRVVAETESSEGSKTLALEEEIEVSEHGWMVARCAGPGYTAAVRHFDHDRRPVMAHTSPVYIDVGVRNPEAGATHRYLKTLVDGGLCYLRQAIHDPDEAITYHHGESNHQAYLEEPFLEALRELDSRIDQWERSK
jgi:hypothetical protein